MLVSSSIDLFGSAFVAQLLIVSTYVHLPQMASQIWIVYGFPLVEG